MTSPREIALVVAQMAKKKGLSKESDFETIRKIVSAQILVYKIIDDKIDIDEEVVFATVLAILDISVEGGHILDDKHNHIPWLNEKQSSISWRMWENYKRYLSNKVSTAVIESVDDSTHQILEQLEDPAREGRWDRRGLVVGDIQSGKTSNFIGLMCKAADAGYKAFIVLSGQTDDLRSQTQRRVDKGFLGWDTNKTLQIDETSKRIGVGLYTDSPQPVVHSLTSSSIEGDFKTSVFRTVSVKFGEAPLLFVLKKNTTVLKNLIKELKGYSDAELEKVPLILVDDEADYASVNTKMRDMFSEEDESENNPSTINGLIRDILKRFGKSAYIGYTATPFANIFIYHDPESKSDYGEDLFPRSFIYNLPLPSNYFGPKRVFGLTDRDNGEYTEQLPIVRIIKDYKKYDKKNPVVDLPASLLNAILSFIIVVAVRNLRGQRGAHNSMLIHAARLNENQAELYGLVQEYFEETKRMLILGGASSSRENLIRSLEDLYINDFIQTGKKFESIIDEPMIYPEFELVLNEIFESISDIQIMLVNSKNKEKTLNYDQYEEGLNVIVIGGDKLSRGLTLEDLSVSFFTRSSKMYDTLLQMGRWFGYKDNFIDLCRLFTTNELVSWYEFVTAANEELRDEFRRMNGLTPEEFGLKVREHPDQLIITSMSKMKNTRVVSFGFAGRKVQTVTFYKSSLENEYNVNLTQKFIKLLRQPNHNIDMSFKSGFQIWDQVASEHVIGFIKSYKSHPVNFATKESGVVEYIEKVNGNGELLNWTVALVSVDSDQKMIFADHEVGLSTRTDVREDPTCDYAMITRSQLISPQHEAIDLSKKEYSDALLLTKQDFDQRGKIYQKIDVPSSWAIRHVRPVNRGLLLIYLLKIRSKSNLDLKYDQPIIGYCISFPDSDNGVRVNYKANSVYIRSMLNDADYEGE